MVCTVLEIQSLTIEFFLESKYCLGHSSHEPQCSMINLISSFYGMQ